MPDLFESFAPFQDLANRILPTLGITFDGGTTTDGATSTGEGPDKNRGKDGAHDLSHILRVWTNVLEIQVTQGGDLEILAAATLLHDCVDVEKNSPLRSSASTLSADRARGILRLMGWDGTRIAAVSHAIEAHSFSAAIKPRTLEARILQDADRLDAIGFIGVARCFSVSGRLGLALYDPQDPAARHRPLDDTRFAIDHFQTKLLKLSQGFQTSRGSVLAAVRHRRLETFLAGLLDEIS